MKRITILFIFLWAATATKGQESFSGMRPTPSFAVKSNLLYDATTSMNLGAEFKIGKRWTLDIPATYNPWEFKDDKKFKFILAQPEARWWTCEPFSGHFFGLHGHYAFYNVSGFGSDYMKAHRFEGWLAGAGLAYGYQFFLAPRWSLEASVGVGYAYMEYDRYRCGDCGDFIQKEDKHYWGLTRAAITLMFFIK